MVIEKGELSMSTDLTKKIMPVDGIYHTAWGDGKFMTVQELAQLLVADKAHEAYADKPEGTIYTISFSSMEDVENNQATDWYGVTKAKVFDEYYGVLLFNYWGGDEFKSHCLTREPASSEEIADCLTEWLTPMLDFNTDTMFVITELRRGERK